MCIKKCLLLLGILIFVSGCSTNASYEYPSNNHHYLAANQNENPTKTGIRYLLGRGVPQSDTQAFEYLLTAAKNDDPFAENEVAFLYASGKGTMQDDKKAFEYYQQAANHGLSSAQYNLGVMYANGLGTPINKTLAQEWFQKSAARGFEPAKLALSKCSAL